MVSNAFFISIYEPTACPWASNELVMFSIKLSTAKLGDLPAVKQN